MQHGETYVLRKAASSFPSKQLRQSSTQEAASSPAAARSQTITSPGAACFAVQQITALPVL